MGVEARDTQNPVSTVGQYKPGLRGGLQIK